MLYSTLQLMRPGAGRVAPQEIKLYTAGADGLEELDIVEATNPGGDYSLNSNQVADPNLFDGVWAAGTPPWLDASFVTLGTSTLQIEIGVSTTVGSYELFTANSPDKRDPVSWRFGFRNDAGDFVQELASWVPIIAWCAARRWACAHAADLKALLRQ